MSAPLDIDTLRAETPGCQTVTHFNHSGNSLPTSRTLAAIHEHLHREALYGGMEIAPDAIKLVEKARADTAEILGAESSEIAFTTSGSAGFGLVFAALPTLRKGDRVLVGRHEWGGNLSTIRTVADRVGAKIDVIPCREDGSVDPEALAAMIDDRVRLVSLTWLPANGGLINDAAAIGKITRKAGIPYFVDAGQALGQMPIDVKEIGCDMLKGTTRKFLRGPRGTALIYVRDGFTDRLNPAFVDVQSGPWQKDGPTPRRDARLFETVEGSLALLVGMGVAIEQAKSLGLETIRTRIRALSTRLRNGLAELPKVNLQDLGSEEKSGLVSFTVDDMDAQSMRRALADRRINVGANGVAYTPYDMTARGLTEIIRASVSYYNTESEIDHLVAAVHEISGKS